MRTWPSKRPHDGRGRPRHAQSGVITRRIRTVALVVALTLVASGCWVYTSAQNSVVLGNIAYFYYKKLATNDVVDLLHYGFNQGDADDTLAFMAGMAKSELVKSRLVATGFLLADFDYFFHPDNANDFATAADDTHEFAFCTSGYDPRAPSHASSSRASCPNDRCLVMHRNANPLGDRHNWTYREDSDRYCVNGRGYV